MTEYHLNQYQYLVMSLMIEHDWQPFDALLDNPNIPGTITLKLGFALKAMPFGLIAWSDDGQYCRMTERGRQVYEQKYGNRRGMTFGALEKAKEMARRTVISADHAEDISDKVKFVVEGSE